MANNARFGIWLRFFTPSSSSTFHFLAAVSAPISRHFHAAFLHLKSSLLSSSRLQSLTALNNLITSAILLLAALLHLHYYDSSPFSARPAAMDAAVSCAAVHYLTSVAAIRFHRRRSLSLLVHHLSLSSAYVSIASLLAALLPGSAAPFVYAVFGSLSAAELACFLYGRVGVAEFECRGWWRFRFSDAYRRWRRSLPV